MALVDLKSNLSWYSAKGIPRGYRPNADRQNLLKSGLPYQIIFSSLGIILNISFGGV